MKRLLLALAVLIITAIAVVIAVAGHLVYTPFRGYAAAEQFVDIPVGSSVGAMGRRLADAGVVRDTLAFRYAVWVSGTARQLKAGEYRFDQPVTAVDVARKIARGDVYLRHITFREGLTIRDMALVFEQEGLGARADFARAAGDASLVTPLDPAATDLEGYLFPDTYAVPRKITAAKLVAMMVDRFRKEYAGPLQQEVERQGRSARQVITLASIVEKETGKADERPLVAAVYSNRLRIGMGLQCDPTVLYALQRAGREVKNLTRDDLQYDSPYNTYRYSGLPPGPIASPGRASLDAALHPADVPYLYFVSRNDGSHAFATTLAEHNHNVYEYQILYWREQRQRERSQ